MDYSKWTLKDFKEWQDMCMHCGTCVARGPMIPHNNQVLPPPEWQSPDRKCPSFEYYNFKSHTGMGRLLLTASAFRDGTPITDDLINIMYTCCSCNMCNELCPTYMPMSVMLAMREEINEQGLKLPAPLPELYENMEEKHNLFGLEQRAKTLPDLPKKGKNLYFTGCYTSYLLPQIAHVNASLLKMGGLDVCHLGIDEHCCGEVAKQAGNHKLFAKIAEENVEAVKKSGAERVIVSCAHCYKTWNEAYPNVLQQDLPFEVLHVTEVLAELLNEGKLNPEHPIKKKVTYHDPCFLRGKDNTSARTILSKIPGLELKEMDRYGRWSYCCGAGGKIALNCYPDFAASVGSERIEEAKKAADEVITACPVCFNQMRYTAKADKVELSVEDISILLAHSLGIDTELNEAYRGDKNEAQS
ncbi:MAG: (Fe-S)-binding protein [Synergistaceae bacterium]|nr:(Fe-S)-binding protein [Synergistaceae bacterium]